MSNLGTVPPLLREALRQRESKEWQRQQLKATSYRMNGEASLAIERKARRDGYTRARARCLAVFADTSRENNWRSIKQLAREARCSPRTMQRTRAQAEADNLIESRILLPGEKLAGMRQPVRHTMVYRHVREVQLYARVGAVLPKNRRRSSAADVPEGETDRPSAEWWDEQAIAQPELSAHFRTMAAAEREREAAQRKRAESAQPPPIATVDLDELDDLERELERQTPAHPERGPPSHRRN